jgi:hypothetical protein
MIAPHPHLLPQTGRSDRLSLRERMEVRVIEV